MQGLFLWLETVFFSGSKPSSPIIPDRGARVGRTTCPRIEIIICPKGAIGFTFLPRRYVVEHSFAWLCCNGRPPKDFETHVENAAAFFVARVRAIFRPVRRGGARYLFECVRPEPGQPDTPPGL